MLIIFSINSFTQTIKIKEPEFLNNVVYVNDTIGDGILLKKQIPTYKNNANAASYIPYVGLFAGKATIRLRFLSHDNGSYTFKNKNNKFIIKCFNNTIDPTTIIKIIKLEPEGEKYLSIVIATGSVFGGGESKNPNTIEYKATKYGDSSYLIELENLDYGNYSFKLIMSNEYILFNILNWMILNDINLFK